MQSGLMRFLCHLTKSSVCIGMDLMVIWFLVARIRRKDEGYVIIYLLLCVLPCIILPLIHSLITEDDRHLHCMDSLPFLLLGEQHSLVAAQK